MTEKAHRGCPGRLVVAAATLPQTQTPQPRRPRTLRFGRLQTGQPPSRSRAAALGARPLGERPGHRRRQPQRRGHARRETQPPKPDRRAGPRLHSRERSGSGHRGAVAPTGVSGQDPHQGPRLRNSSLGRHRNSARRRRLLLRTPQPLAARQQRTNQQPATPLVAQKHRIRQSRPIPNPETTNDNPARTLAYARCSTDEQTLNTRQQPHDNRQLDAPL